MTKHQYPDRCPWCGNLLNIYWLHGQEFVTCDHCTYPYGMRENGDGLEEDDDYNEGEYEWDAGLYEEPDYDQINEDRNPNDSRNL